MHESRVVELPYRGLNDNMLAGPVVQVITVPAAQDEEAPVEAGVEFGVPLPWMVMPILLRTVIPVVQAQFPGGI
jgi:hypothetical protein